MYQYPAVYRCAIQSPLNRLFDYLPPQGHAGPVHPGQRLWVPFGQRKMVAVVVELAQQSEFPPDKLRQAVSIIDQQPIISNSQLQLLSWAADYYHHPLGDTLFSFLPGLLRKGRAAQHLEVSPRQVGAWQLSTHGKALAKAPQNSALKRAPKQASLLAHLHQHSVVTADELKALGISRNIIRAVLEKGLIEPIATGPLPTLPTPTKRPELNSEQQNCINEVSAHFGRYACFLLHGVTGSGKTEVYLRLIDECRQRGQQALLLVPEIGLTPQIVQRFERYFQSPVLLIHSALTEIERHNTWYAAFSGSADILIGTRSAMLAPLERLGLIIVDEEHDSSFKQQEGLRYSARDLAVKRAQLAQIPIVLGSASPSLETLQNAEAGRYTLLELTRRASGLPLPKLTVSDCRELSAERGIALAILKAAERHLEQQQQVMFFLNRRGYAPTLICPQCGWIARCPACDVRLTAHRDFGQRLLCHHCDRRADWPGSCPTCHSQELHTLGAGTQRVEQVLTDYYPAVPIIRVDRDSTQRKGSLLDKLEQARSGQPCILLGTQMLAKGHHFPALSMVAILDADAALYSADFRGPERMAQTITQVAGRAGRAGRQGEVFIQSQLPEHPLVQHIITRPYIDFARHLLEERQQLALPPFARSAALFGEYKSLNELLQTMSELDQQSVRTLGTLAPNTLTRVGPVPAPMPRRANRFRAQLILYASHAKALHSYLAALRQSLDQARLPRDMRLAIDVDPIDTN